MIRIPRVLIAVALVATTLAQQEAPLADAYSLYQHGKWAEAAAAYRTILKDHPKSVKAEIGLSRALLEKNNINESLEAAKKAVELGAQTADAHVALGEVFFRQGLIPESEREFVEGLKIDITNARAFMGRAKVFRAESFFKRAHDFVIQAHKLDPEDPQIRRMWVETLKPSEQLAEMEKYFADVSNDEPNATTNREAALKVLKDAAQHPEKRCRLVTKPDQVKIPLEKFLDGPNWYKGVGLKVDVTGHKSTLLLDTGASGIVLSAKAAEKAGIKPIAHGTIFGIGDKGGAGSFTGRADSIKVGDLEFRDCLVEVTEKKSALDVDGLIGADMFDAYLVNIDTPEQMLLLSQLPKRPGSATENTQVMASDSIADDRDPQDRYIAPSMANYSPFYRSGHLMLLPTRVEEASPRLFLIDTGSYTTWITPEAAREVTRVSGDWTRHAKGISGDVDRIYLADHARISFSHFRQENQGIWSFDLTNVSKPAGVEISGILGFRLFNMMKMTIDYRDGLIDFEYVARPRDPHF
jgi:tetratricopeptide (TPR) repeat protein